MKKYFFSIFIFCLSCDISSSKPIDNPEPVFSINNQDLEGMSKAYFASGCFWGTEYYLQKVPGVISTTVGYMGGSIKNVGYKEVCTGRTGHAEVVKVEFDPSAVSYETLAKHFDEKQIAEIAALVINMNLWTRLKLAQGATPVQKA